MDDPMEIAPIVRQTDRETVFQGAGNSHFSYVEERGFHVTTQVPGIPDGFSTHDPVSDMFPDGY